ncbi:MAG: 50S ribosomal protein L15 [Nitrospirae bacterium]|nr:MAG: 50S ribosomal protein L15 [Nitrospirota bacterium]
MRIEELSPEYGSTKKRKRIGRGPGSGHGRTATKGHKGQKARSGGTKGPSFEGGQTPLQRRLPKRGFKNAPFKKEYAAVNLADLAKHMDKFSDVDAITPEVLIKKKIVKKAKDGIKVLGKGDLGKALIIKAHAFSASAASKISAAGGKAEVITSE